MIELRRSIPFRVDHQRFSPDRAYVALALVDHGEHENADFVFITEAGETIFVPTSQCLAAEPGTYSQSWPTSYRGRRPHGLE